MILVFYINNYHEKYDQVQFDFLSFSAFYKSTVKKYMGIFFNFGKLVGVVITYK